MRSMYSLLAATLVTPGLTRGQDAPVPEDFPRFQVPGFAAEMARLRHMFWVHYPGASPKSTMWDQWLAGPALWPSVTAGNRSDRMRKAWRAMLAKRHIDADGYVATHQHPSIAHQRGWPFPFWNQGKGVGWHWSFDKTVGPPWRKKTLDTGRGWALDGCVGAGIVKAGWRLVMQGKTARLISPPIDLDTTEAPFMQLRWAGEGLGGARIRLLWSVTAEPEFVAARSVSCPVPGAGIRYDMVPMTAVSAWRGRVRRLALQIDNAPEGAAITLQALFSQYDTRHNINSQAFVHGCANYFWWTGDVPFLRANILRMRRALRHLMVEHRIGDHAVIGTTWTGHDGRSGLVLAGGKKRLRHGHGIGNNYWDLLPFGHLDMYATSVYYAALRTMAVLEADVLRHPEWQIPGGESFDPAALKRRAQAAKTEANELFWSEETGRFVACVDADGRTHDFGLTFLNLEAVHYGIATAAHARALLEWVTGSREVAGDTAKGADIYHWRFGPRATTRRNVSWYGWFWSAPESIPWGGQVQDGGAVLGFSYHDLMARLRILGPDDAWQRLRSILAWYGEVREAGGYRAYYKDGSRGRLQGGGVAAGLGIDREFHESVLVPQVMLDGFLGFRPGADGIALAPSLPKSWPELRVNQIRWQDHVLEIHATRDRVVLHRQPARRSIRVLLDGKVHEWKTGATLTLRRGE